MNKGKAALKSTVEILVGCPFCGETPSVDPWPGGGPHNTLVGCVNDDCPATPAVTGSNRAAAIRRWNTSAANAELSGKESRKEDGLL
jgi:hypothetical protein